MLRASTSELKADADNLIDRMNAEGESVVVSRENRDLAVLIPVEDYAHYRQLEDMMDLERIRQIKAEGVEFIDWETLKKEMGLA